MDNLNNINPESLQDNNLSGTNNNGMNGFDRNGISNGGQTTSREFVDNTLNDAGSQALHKSGIPKPLADAAIKKNGGTFSPTNMPGNKMVSNMARNKLANNNSVQRLNDAKNKGLQHNNLSSKMGGNSSNNNDEKNGKSTKEQVEGEAGKKATGAALKPAGVPGPAADMLGDKFGGQVVKQVKRKLIISALLGGAGCAGVGFLIICIIAVLMQPLLLIQDALNQAKDWFSSLGHWITGDGWCADEASCAQNAEEKFYEEVDKLYDHYIGGDKGFELDTDVLIAAALYDDYGDETVVEEGEEDSNQDYDSDDAHEKEKKKYQSARRRLSRLSNALTVGHRNNYRSYKSYLKKDYLPKYYDDILLDDSKERSYQLEMIATEIIAYSQNPDALGAITVRNSKFNTCQSVQLLDSEGNVTDLSLEQYILGVVKAEGSVLHIEAQKALAIAARTYVLKKTSYCSNPIEDSSSAQNYEPIDAVADAELIANLAEVENMILTIDGNVFLTEYDSYFNSEKIQSDGTGGYHCDDKYCYTNYCRLGSDSSCKEVHEVKASVSDKNSFAGGHGRGMAQWGAHYLAKEENKNYKDILGFFYDENAQIEELSYVDEEGLSVDPDTGFLMRVARAIRDNEFYYDIASDSGAAGTLEGECAWYATGRAKEITTSIGSSVIFKDNTHGGLFCRTGDAAKFERGYNYREPRQGALISWFSDPYGHVAVIERVNDDGTVTISESGISFGGLIPEEHSKDWIWKLDGYSLLERQRRRENCEAKNSGCVNFATLSIEDLKYRSGDFQCYIYLTDPLE